MKLPFHERMRARRQARGLSIATLARMSGCHRNTITNYETGRHQMTPEVLKLITRILMLAIPGDESATQNEQQWWEHLSASLEEFF